MIPTGRAAIPQISESVSEDAEGRIHITLANLSADAAEEVDIDLYGRSAVKVTGEILTNEVHAHNTFEAPDTVSLQEFTDIAVAADGLHTKLPACSVVHLVVE